MSNKQLSLKELAKVYGYTLRQVSDGSYFLNAGGDDLMRIKGREVIVYEHDANAFFVASVLANSNSLHQRGNENGRTV